MRNRLTVGASALALVVFCAGCAPTPTAIPEGTVVLTTVQTGAPTTVTVTEGGPAGTDSTTTETVTATVTITQTTATATTDDTNATETTETGGGADTAKFGGSGFTWTDGMNVKISKPADFTPSDYARSDQFDKYVVFTVTITNGSKTKYDPSLFYMTVQSGDQEGDAVFDSAKGINGSPSTALLPGRSVNFKQAFGVKDPKDIVAEVQPGFDYDSAIFTT